MSDIVDFGWVGINPALHIFKHGIILPALLPQFVTHVAVLIRDVVASIMLGQAGLAIVSAGAFEIGRHDIPGDPAFGEMVQGGDEASKRERVVLDDGACETKSDMLGGIGHGRDEQHGVVDRYLGGFGQRGLPGAAKDIVHAEHVGQEDGVELSPLDDLGEFDPLVEVGVLGHMVIVANPQPR